MQLNSERDISDSEKAGFVEQGFLLSGEPFSQGQIATLLELLEIAEEGN